MDSYSTNPPANDPPPRPFSLPWLRECGFILYASFFKPYSYQAYLKQIHPLLQQDGNPFQFRDAFADNPRLHTFAWQSWWLAMLFPLLMTALTALLWSDYFNWDRPLLFLFGWSIGLLAAHQPRISNYVANTYITVVIIYIIYKALPNHTQNDVLLFFQNHISLFNELKLFWNNISLFIIGVAVGVAGGVAGGVAVGVAGGVAFGVAVGV
ncbi:MAG: hypothetical protein HQM06_04330, partial [Magnetococcales bacterium]|nr:hypothetical protein [Magnetococcales bacterium]